MCDFIPFIFVFGCDPKVKQTGNGQAYVCPRCHNASVVTAKSRRTFSLCWIPLIPFPAKEIFACGICQWQAKQDGGFTPQPAGQQGGYPGGGYPQQQGGYPPPQGHHK